MILGFDTSGPYCSTALFDGQTIRAQHHVEMRKGQVENLMPLIEQTLSDGATAFDDLSKIGVGTGPGNFTGIRISVAAARGLGLSLGIPAIGVTLFDALRSEAPGPCLVSLSAPRTQLYVQSYAAGWIGAPEQVALSDIAPQEGAITACIGHRAEEIATHLGLTAIPTRQTPAAAIAQCAAQQSTEARPSPLYLRPADAAQPRDPSPRILT